jgi:hypothetical protein
MSERDESGIARAASLASECACGHTLRFHEAGYSCDFEDGDVLCKCKLFDGKAARSGQ